MSDPLDSPLELPKWNGSEPYTGPITQELTKEQVEAIMNDIEGYTDGYEVPEGQIVLDSIARRHGITETT